MTTDKLKAVFDFYRAWIQREWGIGPLPDASGTHLGHLAWMCEEAATSLVPSGRLEKAMRWLGYVQGVLVARGFFKLDEVKNHSRPDEDHLKLAAGQSGDVG